MHRCNSQLYTGSCFQTKSYLVYITDRYPTSPMGPKADAWIPENRRDKKVRMLPPVTLKKHLQRCWLKGLDEEAIRLKWACVWMMKVDDPLPNITRTGSVCRRFPWCLGTHMASICLVQEWQCILLWYYLLHTVSMLYVAPFEIKNVWLWRHCILHLLSIPCLLLIIIQGRTFFFHQRWIAIFRLYLKGRGIHWVKTNGSVWWVQQFCKP